MSGRVTLAIPRTPPSLNQWQHRHWAAKAREKESWEQEIAFEARRHGLPRCERIEAEIVFRFPDRRRRDCDNVTATLSKFLGDALRPRFIPDDDTLHFWVRSARISPERGSPETLIILDWQAGEEWAV